MKRTDCSVVMDKFLELDKDERIPLWVTKHLLVCSECRNCVRMFTKAEHLLVKDSEAESPFTFATISDVKEKLYPGSTKEKKVPLFYWLVIGILLITCMVFSSFAISRYLPSLQTCSFVFVSLIVSAYCMLFVGMNMDFFVKKTNIQS